MFYQIKWIFADWQRFCQYCKFLSTSSPAGYNVTAHYIPPCKDFVTEIEINKSLLSLVHPLWMIHWLLLLLLFYSVCVADLKITLKGMISHLIAARISLFFPGSCFPNWLQGNPRMANPNGFISSCSAFNSGKRKGIEAFQLQLGDTCVLNYDIISWNLWSYLSPTYWKVYPQYVATFTKRTLLPL